MIKDPSENVTVIPEKGNITLTCGLQIKHSSKVLTLYWIKETVPNLCLFSASSEGSHGSNFSKDVNCCVDADIKKRRTAPPVNFSGRWLNHSLTIINAIPSDSGKYLCVVTIWSNKHVWKIASNVSVEVQNSTLSRESTTAYSLMKQLQISLGVIVSVIPVCGAIWLLCWKKKAKGNPAAERPRSRMEIELEGDDCSPYAVSSRNDIDKDEALYSVVMKPPGHISTLSDSKPTSQPGEKLHTVYALVTK
uniref:Uncharacterized protein n=2 Tax=Sphaerodactylus townsendi TaxID=933632 RepID=A0ACB8E5C8_9SAUR